MGHNVTATSARITAVEEALEVIAGEVFREEAVDSGVAVADAEESKGILQAKVTYPRVAAAISATSLVRDIANQSGSRPALSKSVFVTCGTQDEGGKNNV